MSNKSKATVEFDDEGDEQDVAEQLDPKVTAAVVSGTDWTTETVVKQLERGNIRLNPRFQRRDAWKRDRKSRFIESLIVGLPIPQIVLAESKDQRGTFIVLDGKQRLLAIMQYWGIGDGENNAYDLTGLTLRCDLKRVSFAELSTKPEYEGDFTSLCNQAIRTIVIRNWKDTDFLHTVFLRLNTGSVNLSPQELRQALQPGQFSDYIDQAAGESTSLRELLNLTGPDSRMRDIEIFARFLAFRFFANDYPGRLKQFLDSTFAHFNSEWRSSEAKIVSAQKDFEEGLKELLAVFGDEVARKPTSPQFNRAIFDALIYFHSQSIVRKALKSKRTKVINAYKKLFSEDSGFLKAVESDTAGAPNTAARLKIWGEALSKIAGIDFSIPKIPQSSSAKKKAVSLSRATKKR